MTEWRAIPTIFNGVTFRSRLEAEWAQFCYAVGWEYLYEPQSYLLDGGTHFWPDFYLPKFSLVVETRGYSNEVGDAQIQSFRELLATKNPISSDNKPVKLFMVIGPEESVYASHCNGSVGDVVLLWCGVCGAWGPVYETDANVDFFLDCYADHLRGRRLRDMCFQAVITYWRGHLTFWPETGVKGDAWLSLAEWLRFVQITERNRQRVLYATQNR